MPVHDWTRVDAGLFHHFHQDWSVEIARTLNAGRLPGEYFALVEARGSHPEPDAVVVQSGGRSVSSSALRGGKLFTGPPRASIVQTLNSAAASYARKANRISVRHQLGEVVAVIEIVSPGNKASRAEIRS